MGDWFRSRLLQSEHDTSARHFMTIAYIYHLDAESPATQSGRPFAILSGLRNSHARVRSIFPLRHTRLALRALRRIAASVAGERYLADRHPAMLRDFANETSRKLAGNHYDIVFGPSTLPLAFLETSKPVTVCADATFHSMVDYYPSYCRLTRAQQKSAEEIEHRALQRASMLIYSSHWAANSALSHYGVAKERVVVLPSGANFGAKNKRSEAMRWIERRSSDNVRLLFVGKQWERKGGDIAFDTLRLLRDSGHNATLDIVGATPPSVVAADSRVTTHGQLSIAHDEQRARLNSLFARAHFLLVPSRAEAFGMVFCEANAFGIPAISTDTGGISTIIRDGVNGHKLPLDAGPPEYAKLIGALAGDAARYQRLAESSFTEFEERLNWKVWVETYLKIADQIVAGAATRRNVLSNGTRMHLTGTFQTIEFKEMNLLIVTPTLGQSCFLDETVNCIYRLEARVQHIISCPKDRIAALKERFSRSRVVADQGKEAGLYGAINAGLSCSPRAVGFFHIPQ